MSQDPSGESCGARALVSDRRPWRPLVGRGQVAGRLEVAGAPGRKLLTFIIYRYNPKFQGSRYPQSEAVTSKPRRPQECYESSAQSWNAWHPRS